MRTGPRRYDVAFYVPSIGPLLTSADLSPAGGAETQIFLVSRALAALGKRVCLIAYEFSDAELPASVDGVDIVVRKPYSGRRRLLGKVSEIISIRHVVATVDADVLVTRNAGPVVGLLALAARTARSRFVYSSANVIDFGFSRIDRTRRNLALYGLGLRLADSIIVQTDEQADLCIERVGRTATVIRSIAEIPPTRDSVRTPEVFVWIGRLVWYKRPAAFIDLARALPQARFRMVGVPVPGEEQLADEVRELAAAVPNLELVSPRPRPKLMELLDDAVAVVNTADFEGMPNVFLEGWARGVPALALTHDPDGVIGRHGLGSYAEGDPERLVVVARELWERRGDRAEIETRCRRYLREHHSSTRVAMQWLDALGLVVAEASSADAAEAA